MIVQPKDSIIEEEALAPLVMVKGDVFTRIFSKNLVASDSIKKLKLPPARYDYILKVKLFKLEDGVYKFDKENEYIVSANQTDIELPSGVSYYYIFIEADIIQKEL